MKDGGKGQVGTQPAASGPVTVYMPHMIQDPLTARRRGMRYADNFECTLESHYYDGPVSDRVAVLDFDPATGKLHRPVKFAGTPKGRKRALYQVATNPTHNQIRSRRFIDVSVFATVLRTMKLFQDRYRIGRELTWKNGPQLLVIPRAGNWANAFYDRVLPLSLNRRNLHLLVEECACRGVAGRQTGRSPSGADRRSDSSGRGFGARLHPVRRVVYPAPPRGLATLPPRFARDDAADLDVQISTDSGER
jgi:hypothetical protein